MIIKRLEEMGVHDLNSTILSVLRLFDDKNVDIDSSLLRCKHFLHFLELSLESIRKVNFFNFYELLEEYNKKKTRNFWVNFDEDELGEIFAKEVSSVIRVYNEINERRLWKDKVSSKSTPKYFISFSTIIIKLDMNILKAWM